MAELTDAKVRFLGTLQIAGIIHPHAGQEQVVLDALDVYERDITAADTHADEIADAESGHGVTLYDLSEDDKSVLHEMIESYRKYKRDTQIYSETRADIPAAHEPAGLPSAEDLDAVAAEEAARQATSGAALATEDAPVEIENEGYAVDDGTQVQTEGTGAESEQPEPETDEPQPETEEQQPETDEPVSQDEVVADGD